MTQSTLKSFDWYLAIILLLFYPVAWVLARFRRRGRSQIAVIRPGGMGDLICLDMAIEHLPGSESHNMVYFIDGRSAVWADCRGMSYRRYDLSFFRTLFSSIGRFERVVVTEQRFASAASYGFLIAAGAVPLSGFSTQRLAHLLGRLTDYSPTAEHEVSAFSRLLRDSEGGGSHAEHIEEERLVRPRVYRATSTELWVCVAGLESPSRALSLAEFSRIVRIYAQKRSVVVAAQPSDTAFARGLVDSLERAKLYSGSFCQLCTDLSHAQEVLTIDGGMVHVCSFFGVPTIALFTSGVLEKWRPLGAGSTVIRGGPSELDCRPCARFGQVPPCVNHYACKDFSRIVNRMDR